MEASIDRQGPSVPAQDPGLDAEVEHLGAKLADRKSIVWFARAYLGAFFGVITFGVSMALLHDSEHAKVLFAPAFLLFLGCFVWMLYSYRAGKRLMRVERADFERYRTLRARVGLG